MSASEALSVLLNIYKPERVAVDSDPDRQPNFELLEEFNARIDELEGNKEPDGGDKEQQI